MALKFWNWLLSLFAEKKSPSVSLLEKSTSISSSPSAVKTKASTKNSVLPPWYIIAQNENGVAEIVGTRHNPRVLLYGTYVTLKMTTDDEQHPWCSSFACFCIETSGYESTKSAWARSHLNGPYEIVVTPKVGDLVIFQRGKKSGHVAFFVSDEGEFIKVLGGNQNNKVCYKLYPKKDFLGYRRPNRRKK